MVPVILHTLAFIVCLCVQDMGGPLASAWVLFLMAGCVCLLYQGQYPTKKSPLWYACLAWIIALSMSSFLFTPVPGSAAVLWVLLAMPCLALTIRKEHISMYVKSFGGVITLYAIGLIAQLIIHPSFTFYDTGPRYAWPLLDPNCGAAVLNIALIPALWLAMFKDFRYYLLSAVLIGGVCATGSRAGFMSFGAAASILIAVRYGYGAFIAVIIVGMSGLATLFFLFPDIIVDTAYCFGTRFPIWEASYKLLWVRPWGGLGLGMFGQYYQQIRTEFYTGGWFAHNDILQFGVEMGIPIALLFVALSFIVAASTWRNNLVSGLVFMAVFLEALVEFQYYVPAVSFPLGLVLAYHMLNSRVKSAI